MNYHFAIVDDEPADLKWISSLVSNWAEARGHRVRTDTFPSAEAFLFHYEEDKSYDILLLDIEMGGMDGVTLAKTVRRDNETVQIVFITGYSDYIAEGYEVSALHYLMKPLREEKLFDVLDRAAVRIQRNEKVLLVENAGEMFRIPLPQIHYIDVQKNYITIHTKEDLTVRGSLQEMETQLDPRFFRAGRSLIVNLTMISRVTKTSVYLKDGTELPLPRGQYEAINRAVIDRL